MATPTLSDVRQQFFGSTQAELSALTAAAAAGKTLAGLVAQQWGGEPNVAWTAFTPTWSGTLGNGSIVGKYHRVGRTIHFSIRLTWGSSTSHPAAIQVFGLPVAPAVTSGYFPVGNSVLEQTGVSLFNRSAQWNQDYGGISCNADNTAITNTIPFTWANGHKINIQGTYEAAS